MCPQQRGLCVRSNGVQTGECVRSNGVECVRSNGVGPDLSALAAIVLICGS
jgi:hypothetical protein